MAMNIQQHNLPFDIEHDQSLIKMMIMITIPNYATGLACFSVNLLQVFVKNDMYSLHQTIQTSQTTDKSQTEVSIVVRDDCLGQRCAYKWLLIDCR